MYDYRDQLITLLKNTKSTKHDLTNTAYAVMTMCQIFLDQTDLKPNTETDESKTKKSKTAKADSSKNEVKDDNNANKTKPAKHVTKIIRKARDAKEVLESIPTVAQTKPTYQKISTKNAQPVHSHHTTIQKPAITLKKKYKTFGDALKDIHDQLKIDDNEMAKRIHCYPLRLKQLEDNKVLPTPPEVAKTATLAGLTIANFNAHTQAESFANLF